MDFVNLDNKAHASENPDEKISIYKDITHRAQIDPEFLKSIDYEKFMDSTRVFANLLENEIKTSGLKIAILGYKVDLIGKWDPFNTIKGLPGSEECAVYSSQELANRGHQVTVYMDPPEKSIWKSPFSNPRWLPEHLWNASDNIESYDLVLMWRRFDVVTGRRRGKIVFFWPHDSSIKPPPNINFPNFDGICILSQHQWNQYNELWPGFNKIPYTICGNGILLEHFKSPISYNNPHSIGYFSNYARGLIILIILWPDIKNKFPNATLDVYYGRETWNTMPPNLFQFVIQKLGEYKNMGVTEHGKIGHLELAKAMESTSMLAYPCVAMGETFCITVVKAQAAGMIPVTTRIAALNETVHPDAPCINLIKNNNDIPVYRDLLFSAMERVSSTDTKDERLKYINFASKFTWKNCVDKWLHLYETTLR